MRALRGERGAALRAESGVTGGASGTALRTEPCSDGRRLILLHTRAEIFDALAQGASDLAQPPRTEDHEHDGEDHDEVERLQSTHAP